ncbi:S1C family serine protease [Neolewinella agarilytica]|uniref:S1C family serine protease n=1 Tax=Neolewinella agarilytica TaxID=478744 RepID=UPI002357686A|nr:trypsin-like peptidase domain-containing protein [Neolewinella agarilytica]
MQSFWRLFAAALGGGILAAVLVLAAVGGRKAAVQPATSTDMAPAAAPLSVQNETPMLVADDSEAFPELPLPVDLRAAARVATPTVVHITAHNGGRRREAVKALFNRGDDDEPMIAGGEGSGVIYTSNGYLITNNHVVETATEIIVTTTDRRTFPASMVGADPKSDLAVLKIEANDLPFLELADSDAAEPGQWVLAVGSPLGLTSTVTAGIVSAKGRSIQLFPELDAIESFLQTDAAVNPGNSGGPLVTADGKLLGINTAIASRTGRFQGYSFAIPINLVRRIADDIIEYGSFQRAFLGVEISTLTRSDVKRLKLKNRTEGVVVDAIFAGGSAETAGLLVNDLIIGIGERPIRDLPELTEFIGRAKVGETLNLKVVRNGLVREVIVKMLAAKE